MKLLIVDDHPMFRNGLELLLTRDKAFAGVRVRHAGCLMEAMAAMKGSEPDMILLDLSLPDCEGMAGLLRVRDEHPDIPVVVLSADDRAETILSVIDHGAAGFIPKTAQPGVMEAALSLILAGGVYLPPSVLDESTAPGARKKAPAAGLPLLVSAELGLSPRQVEILRLLVEGKPNKLISRHLGLSEPTVKTHLSALYRKLNVNTRTQAVVRAAQLRLRLRA